MPNSHSHQSSEQVRPYCTVRYHCDNGSWWAECGNWTGSADSLPELRKLAREGMESEHGGAYRSTCYFEWTAPDVQWYGPHAMEEFRPS